jgi:hypothetical protein
VLRQFAIGMLVVLFVLLRPQGVLAEEARVSRHLDRWGRGDRGGGGPAGDGDGTGSGGDEAGGWLGRWRWPGATRA